jgi:hypothetical protein
MLSTNLEPSHEYALRESESPGVPYNTSSLSSMFAVANGKPSGSHPIPVLWTKAILHVIENVGEPIRFDEGALSGTPATG